MFPFGGLKQLHVAQGGELPAKLVLLQAQGTGRVRNGNLPLFLDQVVQPLLERRELMPALAVFEAAGQMYRPGVQVRRGLKASI